MVRKGWGSVARRGASTVRDGTDGHGPDADTPEGRRRARTRADEFVPEQWVQTDRRDRRTAANGTRRIRGRPAHRAVRAPAELPPDIANELASAAGPDWNHLRERITERMAAGIGAYERERYRDASRILKTVVDAGPERPLGPRAARPSASTTRATGRPPCPTSRRSRALTGSVDQHPVRMDCHRALGRPKRVEALFTELRQGSPDPEVLSEGRLVLAGTRADNGRPGRGGDPAGRGRSRPAGAQPGRTAPPAVVRARRPDGALGGPGQGPGALPPDQRGRPRRLRRGRPARVARPPDQGPAARRTGHAAPVRLGRHEPRTTSRRRGGLAAQPRGQGLPGRATSRFPGPTTSTGSSSTRTGRPPCSATSGTVYNTGRLAGTGYLSILPVDQGIEHSAAASFAKFPAYFDPAKLCDLAIAADCNAIATTLGGLGIVSRRYVHRIPFIVKLNHNDFLNYPNTYDQVMFAGVGQASDLGAVGVGATIYFGSEEADRQIVEVSKAFAEAHRLGMFTVLWCYLRNPAFKQGDTDYHLSADLTGQANHLGVTIEADIIKQKQPENNGGYNALKFGKTDPLVYSQLTTDHPIDLTRWQVVNCYAGRIPLINSGGESKGADDLAQAVRTAVINKRAGGAGPDRGPKGVPAPHRRGCGPDPRHPGRLPGPIGDHRLRSGGPGHRGRRPDRWGRRRSRILGARVATVDSSAVAPIRSLGCSSGRTPTEKSNSAEYESGD